MNSTRDVIVQTDRMETAKAFYRDVLGFAVVTDSQRLLGFETGSFTLYVEPGSNPEPVFDFEVDNLVETKELLIANGCTIEEENPQIPRCYVRDPFGLRFNLAER
jgi:catechol 2,3-dioxygenase-like lactoylglutathione lyase family enzyme